MMRLFLVLVVALSLTLQASAASIKADGSDLDVGGDHADLDVQGLYFAATDGTRADQWSQDDDLFRSAADESPAWATPVDSGVGTSSGGWGYEYVITSGGDEFEGGGGVTSDDDIETENELMSFDFGIDVPSSFRVGIYTDQADRAGAPFTPASYRLEIDGNSAEHFMESFDLLGDIYWFALSGVSAGDVLTIYETDSGTAQAGNAGVTGGVLFQGGEIGPLPGDYDMNGVVDAADIDLQAGAMKAPDPDLEKFDENGDGAVDEADRLIWVKEHAGTWVGDANLDNEFNSGDLVTVFAAGKYETGEMASWTEGDWNGDMAFGSGDLVSAFADGGYEQGPPAIAVPEPSTAMLLLCVVLSLATRRRNLPRS